MTHRICVLGNSHIACLRPPWDDLKAAHPDIDLEFFGAPGLRLANLKVHQGLVSGDKELIDYFDRLGMRRGFQLDEFDSFVIVGCQISMFRMTTSDLSILSMPSVQAKRGSNAKQLISEACFQQLIIDRMQQTIAFEIARGLRTETDKPITISPQPFPCASVLAKHTKWPGFRKAVETGDAPLLSVFYQVGVERAFADVADVLVQPEETVVSDICTSNEFTKGSIRLARRAHMHPDDDVQHGNTAYGRKILEALLAEAKAHQQPRAVA